MLVACRRKQKSGIDCTAVLGSLRLTLDQHNAQCSPLPPPRPSLPLRFVCGAAAVTGTVVGSGCPPVRALPGALSAAPVSLASEVSLVRT